MKIMVRDDVDSLRNIGKWVMGAEPRLNAFISTLWNRIGLVIYTSRSWNDPWAIFEKGTLEFGDTIEEIFVNLIKQQSYDPNAAETEWMKQEHPDVRTAFHQINWQKFYKVTLNETDIYQAFTSFEGVRRLLTTIVQQLYTSAAKYNFEGKKYLIARLIVDGYIKPITVPNPASSKANLDEMTIAFQNASLDMTFHNKNWNYAAVYNNVPISDQHYIIPNSTLSRMNVQEWAVAFHKELAEFMGTYIPIDNFTEYDTEILRDIFNIPDGESYTPFTDAELTKLQSVQGLIFDINFIQHYTVERDFRQWENPQGRYRQNLLFESKVLSWSPFADACVFTTLENSVTSVTVSPASANVTQGSQMVLTATVTGTGFINQGVLWSISGNTSDETSISDGKLSVSIDEPANTEITVTATSIEDSSVTATSTITVVAR